MGQPIALVALIHTGLYDDPGIQRMKAIFQMKREQHIIPNCLEGILLLCLDEKMLPWQITQWAFLFQSLLPSLDYELPFQYKSYLKLLS